MFSKRFSPVTGREEWFEMEEDYDFRRDIARSLKDSTCNVNVYHGREL